MPSDPRVAQAAATLAPLVEQYRSAVATTYEDIRSQLVQHASGGVDGAARLRSELGEFAVGRIDADRLNSLLGSRAQLSPAVVDRLERAAATLHDLASRGDGLMLVEVAPGGDLVGDVRSRLAQIGRAFAAARVVASRDAAPVTALEAESLRAFPFSAWSAAERRLGPPLIAVVHGRDFRPVGLAEFLDGLQKIVVVVDDDAPAAALVRLITPGVLVAQSGSPSICEQVANWPGTAIAAIVQSPAAQFVHDPSAGPELWQRVRVIDRSAPTSRIGGFTTAQQFEELRQLEALVQQPAAVGHTAGTGEPAVDPVDRLAAWLLHQTDFSEPAGGH